MGRYDRAAELFNQRRQILRSPCVGGRDRGWIAGSASRSWQRDLRVRNQLLVVLESVIIVGSRGRLSNSSVASGYLRVYCRDRVRRQVVVGVERVVGRGIAGVAVSNQSAGENRRAGRYEVTEPRG